MAPFDRDLILTGDMTENEIRAVDEYHKKVYESISGLLDEETAKWLAEVTKPLGKN
jgi:Xaa-Pro aminopeptidase